MKLKMNLQKKHSILRLMAWLEGISYLLLGISMPLKYMYQIAEPNYIIGMTHGILFIAYTLLVLLVGLERKWNLKIIIILWLLSFIPFGTFYGDQKYLKN